VDEEKAATGSYGSYERGGEVEPHLFLLLLFDVVVVFCQVVE
jgi:hypothetical protein